MAQAEGIRIVQMQQFAMVQNNYSAGDIETAFAEIQAMDKAQKERAEAELAQAYADGFEIANVTAGIGDVILLTVWTLRPALSIKIESDNGAVRVYPVPCDQPPPIKSTRL